ncbi:MAG: serpin family protein [Gemmatimonadota bacterium]
MKQRFNTVSRLTISVLAAAATAGCEGPTGPVPELDALPRSLTAFEEAVIGGSNGFAFDLLREVNEAHRAENVFISPLSVSMALGMTMNGAASETYDQMRSTLGFGSLSQAEINRSYRDLIDLLLGLDPSIETRIANSIWYREGFQVETSFLDAVRASFDAEIHAADFRDPGLVDRVNEWVSSATNGRIDEIMDSVHPDDVMYLINAIYFNASWRQRFEASRTTSENFTGFDGRQIPVRMMNASLAVRHHAGPDLEAVELPYGNGAYTMTVVLPRPGVDVNELLASLDRRRWEEIVGGMSVNELLVSLPRFRLELEESLVEPLKALGMVDAFGSSADFTRMSALHGRDMFIGDVKHMTFVEVDEEGTEAAAVTKVDIRVTSAPPSFRADRPFVFAIRERLSGTILFIGKVAEPESL